MSDLVSNPNSSKETNLFDIDKHGKMRGIVFDVNDVKQEGRVALFIPKVNLQHDLQSASIETNTVPIDLSRHINKADLEGISEKTLTTTNILWARPVFTNSFIVPYKGQTVYCFFEDGDPNKLYYYHDNFPTLNGQVQSGEKIKWTNPWFSPDKKAWIKIFYEAQDQSIHYFDENADTKRWAITFKNNHSMSINENITENSIELITEKGFLLRLDQFNKQNIIQTENKHTITMDDKGKTITIDSTNHHKIILNDNDATITLVTAGGHKVVLDDSSGIKATTSGGHKVDMADSGGTITVAASTGGTVKVGHGSVSIN